MFIKRKKPRKDMNEEESRSSNIVIITNPGTWSNFWI